MLARCLVVSGPGDGRSWAATGLELLLAAEGEGCARVCGLVWSAAPAQRQQRDRRTEDIDADG